MSRKQEFEQALSALYTTETYFEQESMAKHTTFRVGGPAEYYVIPKEAEQLKKTIELCKAYEVPYTIIGNGSNLLVSDKGVEGVVIRMETKDADIQYESCGDITYATAPAGMLLTVFAKELCAQGYAGMEYATGIPGTVGGGVVMNAGAYGGEIKDALHSVLVLTSDGELLCVPAEELELGYRHSVVGEKGYIVVAATFRLERGDKEAIAETVADLSNRRREKQPLEYPSAGSTFKRPEGYFAGKLIQDAGLRGFTVGGAQVSEKHCGFVINRGDATASDVYALIGQVQERVWSAFGVRLETEVRFLGDFA